MRPRWRLPWGEAAARCPFAVHGMESDLLAACPGFAPLDVRFDDGPGEGLRGTTCAHLGRGRTSRGFAALCRHPEAERVVEAARNVSVMIPAVPWWRQPYRISDGGLATGRAQLAPEASARLPDRGVGTRAGRSAPLPRGEQRRPARVAIRSARRRFALWVVGFVARAATGIAGGTVVHGGLVEDDPPNPP